MGFTDITRYGDQVLHSYLVELRKSPNRDRELSNAL
jgi:hypothetical protein